MKLILATRNSHKACEIAAILDQKIQVLTLKDIGFRGEIVENGDTFDENARIKVSQLTDFIRASRQFRKELSMVTLADDSGLEVDALHGAPGVLSARYAGEAAYDEANHRKLLSALKGVPGPNRAACFRCVLAAVWHNGQATQKTEIRIFKGACSGKIGFKPKGQNGFGYDPIFFPEGFCRTFAELTADEKNRISHRAMAIGKFKKWLDSIIHPDFSRGEHRG